MTLPPVESKQVRGVDGPPLLVNDVCGHPECDEPASERHHIYSRGLLKGAYDWWSFKDTDVRYPNVIGLCGKHHLDVTGGIGGHRAAIMLELDKGYYWYVPSDMGWRRLGPLRPQPVEDHVHDDPDTCPTCGRRKERKPKLPPGPPREKTKAVITFPKDEVIVWEELVEQVKALFHRQHESSPYWALVECMVFAIQHKHRMTREDGE